MRNRIVSTERQHISSQEVDAQLWASWLPAITDAAALTIASYWQAPGGHGLAFAQLASTGTVEHSELIDAIEAEMPEARAQGSDHARALEALREWAIGHPSRREAYHAADPLDPAEIRVGSIVRVPVWFQGEVIGWANGEVAQVRACAETSYIVTLQGSPFTESGHNFIGTDALYFGYSIGRAL